MAFGNRLINAGAPTTPQPIGMTYSYTIPAHYVPSGSRAGTTNSGRGIAWDWDRDILLVCMNVTSNYELVYTYDIATSTPSNYMERDTAIEADVAYDGTYYHWSLAVQAQLINASTRAAAGGYFVYPDPAITATRVGYMQGMIMYENSSGNPRIWYGHTYAPYQGITGNLGSFGAASGAITMPTTPLYNGGTWDNYDKFWVCDNTGTIRQKTTSFVNTGLTVSSGFSNTRSIAYMESLQQFAVVGTDNGTIRIFNATY